MSEQIDSRNQAIKIELHELNTLTLLIRKDKHLVDQQTTKSRKSISNLRHEEFGFQNSSEARNERANNIRVEIQDLILVDEIRLHNVLAKRTVNIKRYWRVGGLGLFGRSVVHVHILTVVVG